jgi:hypothetical protein
MQEADDVAQRRNTCAEIKNLLATALQHSQMIMTIFELSVVVVKCCFINQINYYKNKALS